MAVDPLAPDIGLDAAKPAVGLDPLADPNAPAVPGPFKKGFGAAVASTKASLYGAGALAAHAVGATDAEQAALAAAAEHNAASSEQSQGHQLEDVNWSSAKSIADQAKFVLGNAVPTMALMAGGGALGAVAKGLLGRYATSAAAKAALSQVPLLGAVAPDVALEAGGIYPQALEEKVDNPALRAAGGGALAAAFDFIPLLAAEKYLTAAGKGGFGAMAKGALKGAPVGFGLEGTQELLQSVVERASAGQSLTTPDAISDYANSFIGGALPGLLGGGVLGAHRGMKGPAAETPPVNQTTETPVVPGVLPADLYQAPPTAAEVDAQRAAIVTPSVQEPLASTNTGQTPAVNTPVAQNVAENVAPPAVTPSTLATDQVAPAADVAGQRQVAPVSEAVTGPEAPYANQYAAEATAKQLEAETGVPHQVVPHPTLPEHSMIVPQNAAENVATPTATQTALRDEGIVPTLPKELSGAKPRYSYGDKQFALNFESDTDRAAYITAQQKPSKRDASYLKFAMDATGLSAAAVRAHGATVRDTIKGLAKGSDPGTLTVPAHDAQEGRTVITPSEDAIIGANTAGEQLHQRPDGSVYRMQQGHPNFGGDLAAAPAPESGIPASVRAMIHDTGETGVPTEVLHAKTDAAVLNPAGVNPASAQDNGQPTVGSGTITPGSGTITPTSGTIAPKPGRGKNIVTPPAENKVTVGDKIKELDSGIEAIARKTVSREPAELRALQSTVRAIAQSAFAQPEENQRAFIDQQVRKEKVGGSVASKVKKSEVEDLIKRMHESVQGANAQFSKGAIEQAQPKWWNEPTDNAFAPKGMTRGQEQMDWLERHKMPQEGSKYVFYHATPAASVGMLQKDGIRAGSYLAADPETAKHQAGRDRGLAANQVQVTKVLLNPWEFRPGVHPTLREDYKPTSEFKSVAAQALTQPEFDAASPEVQGVIVDRRNAILAAAGQRLASLIGQDPDLKVQTSEMRPHGGTSHGVAGSFTPIGGLKSIIYFATNAKDVLGVMDHEAWHYIEKWKLNAEERAVVARGLAPGTARHAQLMERVQRYDRENKTNLADEVASKPNEAHAYGFQFWRRGELKVEGALQKVFEKIRALLERIVNAVNGLGFKSIEDIFDALDRGEFAERQKIESRAGASESVVRLSSSAARAGQINTPEFRRAGSVVDGRTVRDGVPNQSSIAASFTKYQILPGVREVPMSAMDQEYVKDVQRRGVDAGTQTLADQIKESEEISPLIVAVDAKGLYILEGGHRFDALLKLGARSFPAQVVMDLDDAKFSEIGIGNLIPDSERAQFSKATMANEKEVARGLIHASNFRYQEAKAAADLMEHAGSPDNVIKAGWGATKAELGTGFGHWWAKNMANGNLIARFSNGYKNVLGTFNTFIRYRGSVMSAMMEKIPTWQKASPEDRNAAFKAITDRTLADIKNGSSELTDLRSKLSPKQLKMFDDATVMIEHILRTEFASDAETYKRYFTTPAAYKEWYDARNAWVNTMVNQGYAPLKRYGDHTVRVFGVGHDGKKIDTLYSHYDSPGMASWVAKQYTDELKRKGITALQVEVGTAHKNDQHTGIPLQQFFDTARRNGVEISDTAREQIVQALSAADSITRNRMMHRENVPGFSRDGMRVLADMVTAYSGKLAYAKFASALEAAGTGQPVQSDVVKNQQTGVQEAQISVDDNHENNLWKAEQPLDGFYHNLANEMSNFVLVPDHSGGWSRRSRAMAMMYFIGGSISGAMVNSMSVPMLTAPQLSIHTGSWNAYSTTLTSWKEAWQHQAVMRDIVRLQNKDNDPKNSLGSLDKIEGLRDALHDAWDVLFDTEVHQIMGIAQGQMFSQSNTVQKAIEVWMTPFRISEQMNRVASFIAAYKVGMQDDFKHLDPKTGALNGKEGALTGQDLNNFARNVVDQTQNNYNEANRPGAAKNPVFAIMFMFKSFPLFMTEAIYLMHKANPKAARNMLLGLTMMTGIQGLPFAETIEDLIDTIAQDLFGSTFNTRRAMRNMIKEASEAIVGYDASELVLRGVINDIFGMSASSRIGAGDFVPGTRLGTADADAGRTLTSLLGAPVSMGIDVAKNIGPLVQGIAGGDWKQAADALRAGGPAAVRNLIKGTEQFNNGYASDAHGQKILDVSSLEALFQTMGVTPASLNKMYQTDMIDRQTKAFYTQVRAGMQNSLVQALRAGDSEKAAEIWSNATKWDEANPDEPLRLSGATIRRQIMLGGMPLNQRTMMLLPRQLRGTSVAAEGMNQQ
jgi:hypothetical protein